MNKEDIKIGQRVRCIMEGHCRKGQVATITIINDCDDIGPIFNVRWDDRAGGYIRWYFDKVETKFEIYIVDDCS